MTKNKKPDLDLSFIKQTFFKRNLSNFLEHLFRKKLSIEGILLFGSVAKGMGRITDNYISDLDLIIISKDLPRDLWERRRFTSDLTQSVSAGIQALWWTAEEMKSHVKEKFYLVLDALDEGKIIHDPAGFIRSLKKKLFEELVEKGVIKTDLYWQWPIKYFGEKINF